MDLENLVVDAADPRRLGRFWEAALGCTPLTDEPEGYETRLAVGDAFALDLCFQRVPGRPPSGPRLHPDLHPGADQARTVDRLLGLGARPLDIGQGDVPWVVLADPEGNAFCVLEERPVHARTGPLAALPLASAAPRRDGAFWAWLTGWESMPAVDPVSLRHPSGRGPLLELVPERAAKGAAKNRLHLDVRLGPDDDPGAIAAGIAARGGRELHPDWGALPWRVFADPSGNEFCVLPARA
ncbi:VOC family protein [Citricoccus sp. SGAir0253]|uniref:VOC family protein n=1 Tax=Citricoccus sp. SGAir0253 TaxID=2567881 RepID=UPI0010CD0A3C|nr:VOC family protein [Citricoccus sp. SGAir0253]QCU77632.1 VOC family protein [Citricoccus sp. SGAir0253]